MSMMLEGIADALQPATVAFTLLGVLLGYVVGVLPGLNRPAALAIAIPLSYYMVPLSAIAFLVGIAKSSGAGGATTAILLNTPGEPNAAATCLDGYPMARAGKGEKALKIALYGSVIGDLLATIALIVMAPPLAIFALKIGPLEMTALMMLSLTFIAALSGSSLTRGLIAGIAGILVATVGLDIESATPRLTFGSIELFDGVPLLAVTVGMLALTEMLIQAEEFLRSNSAAGDLINVDNEQDRSLKWNEFAYVLPTILKSSMIGVLIGLVPGLGPTVASFLSYAFAKKTAKSTDKFGQGEPKGVAAAETADNAVVPASMIPLFALGLPGSVSAAIIIAAFMVHGVTPGPRMFEEHGQLMYGIFAAMIMASLLMLLVGRVGLMAFAKISKVPQTIVIPVVVALCLVGSYLETHSIFSVQITVAFALLGYVMHRFDYSRVTFLVGFVVGPLFELSLRQSVIITQGQIAQLTRHPIAVILLVLTFIAAIVMTRNVER
jgi:putative tricarboxylic transport membrane protein